MIENGKASKDSTTTNGAWKSAIFIIFVEMAERFAYYGVAANLFTYLTTVLGESIATAAKSVNTWVGVSCLFPILGAFLADSYLGRFTTILISSIVYLAGLILLTVSVSVVPRRRRSTVLYLSLYVLSVGEGGHKPCVQTFAADQFDEGSAEQRRVKSSFFNWWYLGIVAGSTTAVLVVIYVQDYVSWTVGFGMPTVAVAAALVVFLLGISKYRRQRPAGSPFTRVAQVFVAAAKKRRVRGTLLHGDSSSRTNQFRCLDRAAMIDPTNESVINRDPWRLCPQNQVEEVKLVLRLIPIWLCCFMFYITIAQLGTFFTKQGGTLDRSIGRHFKVPAASLQVLPGIAILVFVLVYDRVLVPLARSITGHPNGITVLQRMGIGMVFSTLTMAVCALVEARRLGVARAHGLVDVPKATLPMRVWWLIPQYILVGLSDANTVVGMQELFYDQMPEEMRSMGAAAYISTVGIGNFLSTALITIVQRATRNREQWLSNNLNRAHLDRFYWLLAGLSLLNFFVYVWVASGFVYKKTAAVGPEEEEQDKNGNYSLHA